MTNTDVEAGGSPTEPLLSVAETSTSNNQRRPLGKCSKFLFITFAALLRVLYALFYMIPCRPNNTNNGFITVAERSMFISAPMINLISIAMEAFAGAIGPLAIIFTGFGSVFTFVAGFYYGKEVVSEDATADILWIIGGICLSVGHGFDAFWHWMRGWNSAFVAKLIALVGTWMFIVIGMIDLTAFGADSDSFDFDTFKDFFFVVGFFSFVHAVTLVAAQIVDFDCKRRREAPQR